MSDDEFFADGQPEDNNESDSQDVVEDEFFADEQKVDDTMEAQSDAEMDGNDDDDDDDDQPIDEFFQDEQPRENDEEEEDSDDDDDELIVKHRRPVETSKSKGAAKSVGTKVAAKQNAILSDDDDDDDDDDEDKKIGKKKDSKKKKAAKESKRRDRPSWGLPIKIIFDPKTGKDLMRVKEYCGLTRTNADGRDIHFELFQGDFFVAAPEKKGEKEQIYCMDMCAIDVRQHHTVIRAQLVVRNPNDKNKKALYKTAIWKKWTRKFGVILKKLVVWTPEQRNKNAEFEWNHGYAYIEKDAEGYETVSTFIEKNTDSAELANKNFTVPSKNFLLNAEKLTDTCIRDPRDASSNNKKKTTKPVIASVPKKKTKKVAETTTSTSSKKRARDDDGDDSDSDSETETRRHSHHHHHRSTKKQRTDSSSGDDGLEEIIKSIKEHRTDFSLRQLLDMQHTVKTTIDRLDHV